MMTAQHPASAMGSSNHGGGGADSYEFPSPRLFKQQQQRGGDPAGVAGGYHEGKEPANGVNYDDEREHQHHRSGASVTSLSSSQHEDELTSSPANNATTTTPPYLPSQEELALLCLDHLRDVRRNMAATDNSARSSSVSSSLEEKENRRSRASALSGIDEDIGKGSRGENKDEENAKDNDDEDGHGVTSIHSRLNPHYLTIAVWALQRAFVQPPLSVSNDPATDHHMVMGDSSKRTTTPRASSLPSLPPKKLPSLPDMEAEVLTVPTVDEDTGAEAPVVYEHDDTHPSNAYRFYRNHGLGGGGGSGHEHPEQPWTLGELVTAGLSGLESQSRRAAEQELCQTPLFQQFVAAVAERWFFDDVTTAAKGAAAVTPASAAATTTTTTPTPNNANSSAYHEKFQKVVAKFRTKLACQGNTDPENKPSFAGDWVALAAAEKYGHLQRHAFHPNHLATHKDEEEKKVDAENTEAPKESRFPASLKLSIESPSGFAPSASAAPRMFFAGPSPRVPSTSHDPEPRLARDVPHVEGFTPAHHDRTDAKKDMTDEDQGNHSNMNDASLQAAAEGLKNQGNVHMQQREFEKAADCYSKAIELCPSGPHSHVYFSNRAAALVSIRQFHLAIADSQRSLALKPDYGKAYARLGLAHFLLGQYELAVHAYTESLRYEPDNRSSQNYLDKATRRLADQQREQQLATPVPSAPPLPSSQQQQSAMGTSSSVGAKPHAGRMDPTGVSNTSQSPPPPTSSAPSHAHVSEPHRHESARRTPTIASSPSGTPLTSQQQQAEKYKAKGNQCMVQREYRNAYDAYTRAIELSRDGPQSHVYYSNRAAALCYLERYREAEKDSLSSLQLVPNYGKAHARLGLSRFFVGDYEGAVSSYQRALEHDPDNAASKSYLLKAQAKLQQQQRGNE